MDIAKLHAEGRKFRTSRGVPVRIIATDILSAFNVVYIEECDVYTQQCGNDGDGDLELVPIEERDGWVIISKSHGVLPTIWTDKEAATGHRNKCFNWGKVARITWQE